MTPWWLYVPPSRALSTPSSHVHRLESTLRHSLSKPHKPSGLHHVFPRPRSRPPTASRSYVVITEITAVSCFDRHPRRSVRQSSPTQPKLSDCNHASPYVVFARTSMHCLTPCVCMILPRRAPDSSMPYTHVAILGSRLTTRRTTPLLPCRSP